MDPRPSFSAATRVYDIASIESHPRHPRKGAATARPRVLLVEDNLGALETFASFFRAARFDVRFAATGAAALMAARAGGVHVVVADLCLPDLTGLELLAELRALGLGMPFIMMSGHGTPELRTRAMDAGAVAFLAKPVDGDDLIRAVRLIIQTEVSTSRRAAAPASLPTAGGTQPRSEAMAEITALVAGQAPAGNSTALIEVRRCLAEALVATIVRPNLTVCELLACAKALRRVVRARHEASPSEIIDDALDALVRPSMPDTRQPYHAKVIEALAQLASPDGTGLCMSEQDLGREVGISGSRLGRLLRGQTGLAFWEWRRGFRMRHAVQRLAVIDDDVYHIADSLGYRHASQFDDEFRDAFGLSPRAFRATLRAFAVSC